MPTAVVRLATDRRRAEIIAAHAEDTLPLSDISIARFEAPDGSWTVEFYSPPNADPAAFEAAVREALGEVAGDATMTVEDVQDADWVAQSLAGLDPVRAGRFIVHSARDRPSIPPNAIGIQVEAALAFGTGHHGTTRGCLLALDRVLKRLQPRFVLDLGTGTGVLAIAAARALRRPVLASDIDPFSVRIARENAALNGAGRLVHVVEAAGFGHPAMREGAPFDLILANILAEPLVTLAPAVAAHAAPGATVILSGLLAAQAPSVLAAYRARGFVPERRDLLEGWATLTLTRV